MRESNYVGAGMRGRYPSDHQPDRGCDMEADFAGANDQYAEQEGG